MWKKVKELVRGTTPNKVRKFFAHETGNEFATLSYAQEGEDILLKRIFERQATGFYVDVGAHHPFRFSNTKLLYDRGWQGINIEPNPDVIDLFIKHRPRDIHVAGGIARSQSVLTYYRHHHPALNTFRREHVPGKEPSSTMEIPVLPLSSILSAHIESDQTIDLLSIDAEGMDLEILQSNDWTLYRPRYILVEVKRCSIEELLDSEIQLYLKSKNYTLISKLWKSCLYEITPM